MATRRLRVNTTGEEGRMEALAYSIGRNIATEVTEEFFDVLLDAVKKEAMDIIKASGEETKWKSKGNLVRNIEMMRNGDRFTIDFRRTLKYPQINLPIGEKKTIFPKNSRMLKWPNRRGVMKRGRGGVLYRPTHLFARKVNYPGQDILNRSVAGTERYFDVLLLKAISLAQQKHNADLSMRNMVINERGYKVRRRTR